MSFCAIVSDPDQPTNTLSFMLDVFAVVPPEPTSATLNATTGEFRWASTEADVGNEVYFVISVTDNGVPALASSRGFMVSVIPSARITVAINLTANAKPRLTWNSTSGRRYQVRNRTSLDETAWTSLGSPVAATGATSEFTGDSLGAAQRRFYRIEPYLFYSAAVFGHSPPVRPDSARLPLQTNQK